LFLTRYFYRVLYFTKSILKKVIPDRLRLYLKKTGGGRLKGLKYPTILLEEWASKKGVEKSLILKQGLDQGVNIVGFLNSATGLGEAARSTAKGLEIAGIRYNLVDIDYDVPSRQRIDYLIKNKKTNLFPNAINLLHVNPTHMPYLWEAYGENNLLNRYTIGIWYWELPEIPDQWVSSFQLLDEIWVPTRFVYNAVFPKSTKPIYLIPPVIEVPFDSSISRTDFNLPEDSFLFLCAYDVLSVMERKNPWGVVDAFRNAFRPDDRRVGLVIKINNAEENPEGVASLEESLSVYSNCYFIKEIIPRKKFNSLLNLVNAYVSLHRAEGFGLVAAEAMYLGKPVIMTRWSGNVDFMTNDNSCGVDYRLIPVGEGILPYLPNQLWADPDIIQAANYMKRLFNDPGYAAVIGRNAKQTIISTFSSKEVGMLMRSRIVSIRANFG
jgi:glycosyltransferase involved in cell wall biosynthesis